MFESSNQRQFQKGLDTDKMRMNRRDTQLSLRKKTREAHLQKRMRLLSSRATAGSANAVGPDGNPNANSVSRDDIPKYVHNVMQPDSLKLQYSGMRSLRILLSMQRSPPIEQVVKTGVVPKIVDFISNPVDEGEQRGSTLSEEQKLRFEIQQEAAWVVTNLASSTNAITTMIVNLGATEKLVEMVRTATSDDAVDMAMWGLGNIAGENKMMTERVVRTGFLDDLITALPSMSVRIQGNGTWLLSNIMRNSPKLSREQYERLIPALAQTVRTAGAQDAITSLLWTLNSMSNSEDLCMMMAKQGIVDDIVRLVQQEVQKCERTMALKKAQLQKGEAMLQFKGNRGQSQLLVTKNITIEAQKAMDHSIYKPSLRFLGNVVSGPDEATQIALNAGLLDVLDPFLNHFSSQLRRETLWAISNILAGSPSQIETVLSRDKLLQSIMRAAKSDNMAVRREACWCLGNATVDAVSAQIKKLADFGAIEALCRMLSPAYELTEDHTKVIVEALESFLKIYGRGGYNPYADQVEEFNGLDYLEDRQSDPKISESTYNVIVDLMNKYWGSDDEFDQGVADEVALKDQLAAAVDAKTNTFKFGCSGSAENLSILGNTKFQSNNNTNNTAIYQF